MNPERRKMQKALQEVFVPALRARGFKGSMPHFYRASPKQADFLTVQFSSSGGSFVVEIAKCGPNGIEEGFGSQIPLAKLKPYYFRNRRRLGSDPEKGILDHWFKFGLRSYEGPGPVKSADHYHAIADSIIPLLDSQAEPWWADPGIRPC